MSKNNDQLRKKVIRLVGKVIRLNNGVFTIETPKHLRKVEQQKQERKQNKILSFGQRKALEQGQLMFGFDQYGKYWLPRKLMNAINIFGDYFNDNEKIVKEKVPLLLSVDSYDEMMDFIDSITSHRLTIKAFNNFTGENEKIKILLSEENYHQLIDYFRQYEWDNNLVSEPEIPTEDNVDWVQYDDNKTEND